MSFCIFCWQLNNICIYDDEPLHMVVPDEVCEVTPVLWVYVTHVPLEVLSTDLHLPLQTGLIAGFPRPGGGGLYVETVSG